MRLSCWPTRSPSAPRRRRYRVATMSRIRRIVATLATGALVVGCGDEDSTHSERPSDAGPKLGDNCRATSAGGSLVEVVTESGPLECAEAKSVLSAYYSNLENSEGSGAGLQVGDWFCISAAPTQAPRAGGCTHEGDGRQFSLVSVGDSPEEERDQLEQAVVDRLTTSDMFVGQTGRCAADRIRRLSDRELERASDLASDTFAIEVGFDALLICAGATPDLARCIMDELVPLIGQRGPNVSRSEFDSLQKYTSRIRATCVAPPAEPPESPLGSGYPPAGECGYSPKTGDPLCVNPDGTLRYDSSG